MPEPRYYNLSDPFEHALYSREVEYLNQVSDARNQQRVTAHIRSQARHLYTDARAGGVGGHPFSYPDAALDSEWRGGSAADRKAHGERLCVYVNRLQAVIERPPDGGRGSGDGGGGWEKDS